MEENNENQMKQKNSFWKDKKNVAIVILTFLLFCMAIGVSGEPTPSGSASNLKSGANIVAQGDTEIRKQLEEAQNTIKYLNEQIEKNDEVDEESELNKSKIAEYENQLQALQLEKTNLETKVNELNVEKENLQSQLNEANQKQVASTTQASSVPATVTTPTIHHEEEHHTNTCTVYVTNTGNKYHRDGCSYLKSKISKDKDDAIAQGYTACSRCNP